MIWHITFYYVLPILGYLIMFGISSESFYRFTNTDRFEANFLGAVWPVTFLFWISQRAVHHIFNGLEAQYERKKKLRQQRVKELQEENKEFQRLLEESKEELRRRDAGVDHRFQ